MLILLAAVLVLILVPGVGGRWTSVLDLPLRASWLLAVALAIQVVTISVVPDGPDTLYRVLHVGSYALAGLFLWANRSIPWLWLVTVGGACNLAVITANEGVMPASPSALRSVGRAAEAGFANSGAVAHAHLALLGDNFATPSWLPLANVFSAGDVVLLLGFALLVGSASRRASESPPARAACASGVNHVVMGPLDDARTGTDAR